MAAEDILGISGQIDISDIQTTLDKLCDQLNKVGVDADALSQRMTNALNDIAKSDGDLSTKTTQAMNVLKQAMDEATNGIKIVPEMIDTANKRVETIRGTIERLNEQLSQTERGSNAFNAIAKQIDAQKQVLQMNQEDARFLASSYDEVRNSIAQVSGAYQALEAISVASSTANTIDAAASEANSVAKTANSVASTANAASIWLRAYLMLIMLLNLVRKQMRLCKIPKQGRSIKKTFLPKSRCMADLLTECNKAAYLRSNINVL